MMKLLDLYQGFSKLLAMTMLSEIGNKGKGGIAGHRKEEKERKTNNFFEIIKILFKKNVYVNAGHAT